MNVRPQAGCLLAYIHQKQAVCERLLHCINTLIFAKGKNANETLPVPSTAGCSSLQPPNNDQFIDKSGSRC